MIRLRTILFVGLIGGLVLYIENVFKLSIPAYTNLIEATDILIIVTSLVILKFFKKLKPSYLLLVVVGFINYLISNFLLAVTRTLFNDVTHFSSIRGYLNLYIPLIGVGLLMSIILAFVIYILPKK
jgi:hypothetical protein